eukprot:5125828-Amphidinium_carterae.1
MDAIEAWAHVLDSQLANDEGAADGATFRARDLLDALAKQAVIDVHADRYAEVVAKIQTLEGKMGNAPGLPQMAPQGRNYYVTPVDTSSRSPEALEQMRLQLQELDQRVAACSVSVAGLQETIDLKEYGTSDHIPVDKFEKVVRAIAGVTQKSMRTEQQVALLSKQLDEVRQSQSQPQDTQQH